jgi:hypothetical protein
VKIRPLEDMQTENRKRRMKKDNIEKKKGVTA